MEDQCKCTSDFDGDTPSFRRVMWIVIALNGSMFAVEWVAGHACDSHALRADALDFLGDAITYGLSLFVIGHSLRTRAIASLLKGFSLSAMAFWVICSAAYGFFAGTSPESQTMSVVGFMALCVNLISVMLLLQYRDGDANIRSVWLCSRNDAIGNVMVIFAAFAVWKTGTAWPDLVVAVAMASLYFNSSVEIFRRALKDYRHSFAHTVHV